MEIKDLQPRQGNVDLTVEVIDKSDVREFQKFGRSGRVATATVKDASGEVKLTLWNESVDQVNVGDKLQLKNCYVNEFQGEMQLTTGKFGSIEVIGKAEATEAPAEPAAEETPAEKAPAEEAPEEESAVEEEDMSEGE